MELHKLVVRNTSLSLLTSPTENTTRSCACGGWLAFCCGSCSWQRWPALAAACVVVKKNGGGGRRSQGGIDRKKGTTRDETRRIPEKVNVMFNRRACCPHRWHCGLLKCKTPSTAVLFVLSSWKCFNNKETTHKKISLRIEKLKTCANGMHSPFLTHGLSLWWSTISEPN